MSVSLAIVAALASAGWLLNRDGKHSRKPLERRDHIDPEEKPNSKNTYHSERYYDTYLDEFTRATENHDDAQDTINENVVPRFYNKLGAMERTPPEIQAYIDKRGSRLREWQQRVLGRKSGINEGGDEQDITETPMFNPLGVGGGSTTVDAANPEALGRSTEQFQVTDRKAATGLQSQTSGRSYGIGQPTKQEHFQSYTMHGPRNSNNPNFHNNMVPYFGSHVKQNTDPHAQAARLEAFTGQTNGIAEFRSQPKREIPNLGDLTPGQTFIYGTPADLSYQKDRYWTSQNKETVTPIEQTRVGPGISPGRYDAQPRDGFHPWYRPEYRNVDVLRVNPKNVYEGRLLPGEEIVKNRGIEGQVFKRRPDTFWINDPRRWFKTTGANLAPKIRENVVAYKQAREDTNVEYQGIAGATEGTRAPNTTVYTEGQATNPGCPGTGTSLNAQVQHTDRNQLAHTPFRNAGATSTNKGIKYPYDKARATTKQTTFVRDYQGGPGTEALTKGTKHPYDEARATTKQTTFVRDYQGGPGTEALTKGTKHPYDKARATTKQTTYVRDYQGGPGTEALTKGTKYPYDKARATTKQTAFVRDYQGGPGTEALTKGTKYPYDKARATTKQTTCVRDYQGGPGTEALTKGTKYPYDKARATTKQTTYVRDYQGGPGTEALTKGTKYPYDKARATTKQTTFVRDYQGGAGTGCTEKSTKRFYDQARATTKQTTLAQDYQGIGSAATTHKGQKYPYDDARATTKQTTYVRDYQGIAGSGQTAKAKKYLYDQARATTKQTTLAQDYMGVAGTGDTEAFQNRNQYDNAVTNNQQESLLEGRTFGPNAGQTAAVGACDLNVQIRSRTGYDVTQYGPNETKLYQAIPSTEISKGATTTRGQREQEGIRQPYNYVVSQFQTNPYTQSLHSAPKFTSGTYGSQCLKEI